MLELIVTVVAGLFMLGLFGYGIWMVNYARIHHPIQTRLKNYVR